jgi:hypothetical protein
MHQARQFRFGTHNEPLKVDKELFIDPVRCRLQGVSRRQTGGEQDPQDRGLLMDRFVRGDNRVSRFRSSPTASGVGFGHRAEGCTSARLRRR